MFGVQDLYSIYLGEWMLLAGFVPMRNCTHNNPKHIQYVNVGHDGNYLEFPPLMLDKNIILTKF
jgi:hypothetical protein